MSSFFPLIQFSLDQIFGLPEFSKAHTLNHFLTKGLFMLYSRCTYGYGRSPLIALCVILMETD